MVAKGEKDESGGRNGGSDRAVMRDRQEVRPGGQGRVKNPESDRRLKRNREKS